MQELDETFFEQLISHCDQQMLDVEQQKQQIISIFTTFSRQWQGDSVMVTGPRKNGRTTIVNMGLDAVPSVRNCCVILHLDVGMENSDGKLQELVKIESVEKEEKKAKGKSREDTRRKVIIVRGADELASRSKQVLLYQLLNATRTKPWLVLLFVNRQDFLSCLEKRVRSRVSSKKVQFENGPPIWQKYWENLRKLLTPTPSVPSEWNNLLDQFFNSQQIKASVEQLFQSCCYYDVLKTIVSVFLGFLYESGVSLLSEMTSYWMDSVEMCVPSEHQMNSTIKSLPFRSLCLLLCVMRRTRHVSSHGFDAVLSYKKIVTDYKQMCNHADTRMAVDSDTVLFKDLDRLIDLCLLATTDSKNNNLAFRRVLLRCDPLEMQEVLDKCQIPTSIGEWYKGQPTV